MLDNNLPASEQWLSVADAVLHCHHRGLNRTAKTVRKWANRSAAHPEEAEIKVRREDTENGFRWVIAQDSLDRKIDEELEFEARREGEPVQTDPDGFEPVHTGAAMENNDELGAHPSEPVPTGSNEFAPVRSESVSDMATWMREQMAEKDRQIEKLNQQIERKDEQIMTMLERDRETNLLINGLQTALTTTLGIESPRRRERDTADSPVNPNQRQFSFTPESIRHGQHDVHRREYEDSAEGV